MSQKFNPENPFEDIHQEPDSSNDSQSLEEQGLQVDAFFSTPGVHPFDKLQWEKRSAKIASDSGDAVFEQDNIEIPTTWSQLATKVVASKYFFGDIETGQRENSLKQLVHRVSRTIANRGKKGLPGQKGPD